MMTGTGTQTDPFIIKAEDTLAQKWADFITAIGTSGAYVQCPSEVWDMNEIAPTGISEVTIYATQINGNGLTIRNLTFNNGGNGLCFYKSCTINNLHITDFYKTQQGNYFINNTSYTVYFNLCKISGLVDGGAFNRKASTARCHFSRCFLNIEFNNGSYIIRYYLGGGAYCVLDCEHCVIILSGNSASSYDSNNNLINCLKITDCMLIGECPFSQIRFANSVNSAGYCSNSVIDMTTADVAIYNIAGTESAGSISNLLINSDKAGADSLAFEGVTPVTPAQLSNAEYLSSIGFPIGVN